jgi:hypothetical protein
LVLLENLGIEVSLPNEVLTHGGDIEKRRLPLFVDGTFDFVGSFRQTDKAELRPDFTCRIRMASGRCVTAALRLGLEWPKRK